MKLLLLQIEKIFRRQTARVSQGFIDSKLLMVAMRLGTQKCHAAIMSVDVPYLSCALMSVPAALNKFTFVAGIVPG